jgi:hypothetical protein
MACAGWLWRFLMLIDKSLSIVGRHLWSSLLVQAARFHLVVSILTKYWTTLNIHS